MVVYEKTKEFFSGILTDTKNNKKLLFIGIAIGIIVVALVLFLPLKTISTQRVQTYYEMEVTKEPYNVTETFTTEETITRTRVLVNGFYKVVPMGIIIPFTVDQPSARITGNFENSIQGRFAIQGLGDRVVWETMGSRSSVDIELPGGQYSVLFKEDVMWGEDCFIYLTMRWSSTEPSIEYRTITKYREVPVQVAKQRVITEKLNVPIWRYIFSSG